MTEAEWLTCTDPDKMLEYLGSEASDRKLRLFACLCCRGIWDLLSDQRSRQAVETNERYADGVASKKELKAARAEAVAAAREAVVGPVRDDAANAAYLATERVALDAAALTARVARNAVTLEAAGRTRLAWHEAEERVRSYQAALVRELFGKPFCPVAVEQAWLSWNDSCVVKIAQAIYDERRFQDLPTLADALEDAGCDNADILKHCREPAEHVRGWWVVDLLLGKG